MLEFSFGDWFKIKGKCLTFGLICMQITVKTDSGPSDPFSFFWVGLGGQDDILIGFGILVLLDKRVHSGVTLAGAALLRLQMRPAHSKA